MVEALLLAVAKAGGIAVLVGSLFAFITLASMVTFKILDIIMVYVNPTGLAVLVMLTTLVFLLALAVLIGSEIFPLIASIVLV